MRARGVAGRAGGANTWDPAELASLESCPHPRLRELTHPVAAVRGQDTTATATVPQKLPASTDGAGEWDVLLQTPPPAP